MSLSNLDVVAILQLGVTGLGFLLALLAFWLLLNEQRVKEPRVVYLQSVKLFMIFSILLCLIGLAPQVLAAYSGPSDEVVSKYDAKLQETQEAHRSLERDLASMTAALERAKDQSARVVFQKVCSNQYFQCDRQLYAESQKHPYRSMTPVEKQVCNLACK